MIQTKMKSKSAKQEFRDTPASRVSASNEDILRRLTVNTFQVQLHSIDAALTVRRLPFEALSRIINIIATSVQMQVVSARKELQTNIEALVARGPDAEFTLSDVLPILVSAIESLATAVPEVTEIVVQSTVVDVGPAAYDTLPVEDTVAIVTAVLEHMDMNFLSEKLSLVFQNAMTLMTALSRRNQTETIQTAPNNGTSTAVSE